MKTVIELTSEQYEALRMQNKTASLQEVEYFTLAMINGTKIEAIKALRAITDCGLKEGLDFFEKYRYNFKNND